MKFLRRLPAGIDRLSLYAFRGAAVLTLIVVLVGAFNAVARYAGRQFGIDASSNGLLELQWYLFGALFLLAGAEALKRNAHVRVDVLHSRLSPRARARIDLVGHLLFLLPFCFFMIWVSFAPVLDSWQRLEGSPDPQGLPRYLVKSLLPLGFALLFLQGVGECVRCFARWREGGERPPTETDPEGSLAS